MTATDQSTTEKRTTRRRLPAWQEFLLLVVLAFGLAVLIKTFLVQAFFIPSGSMENTLQVGDRVLVNKVVYHTRDIERGDIVVFNGLDSFTPETSVRAPTNPVSRALRWVGSAIGVAQPGEQDFIKRVIGIPGDHVTCAGAGQPVKVNGVALSEGSYIYENDTPSADSFDVVVPPGRLWVMGDHRSNSADSRSHEQEEGGGTVPANKVIGRAFVVVWPFSHATLLHIPDTFEQSGLTPAALSAGRAGSSSAGVLPAALVVTGAAREDGRRGAAVPAAT